MNNETINAVTKRLGALPPDPENMNEKRTGWADAALSMFMEETGTDEVDCVADLLANLMHWCDRNGQDFVDQLGRARDNYLCETTAE
jgi:hypothetical protein